ncbi:MAG: hypothetical protein AVDCRST_MAG59-4867 [uncultured Thermomicrobiales bacterium]|uniref:Tail specific protease domain-containing protein n=1 Tax=uncultured Thermomicrobiales bacterium TaxID=1645740 RepID=A0A6J4VPZ8_9BACT|nr:MAG: hypothetical protein AVDCRST_MAG59-4867 [uncultured Thermomicrobiales bacterium]
MVGINRSRPGRYRWISIVALMAIVLPSIVALADAAAAQAEGVEQVSGEVVITSPLIGRAFSQPFILLTDLTAFVERDLLMPLPSPVQVTGNLEGELGDGASFTIPLPQRPLGQANDLDRDGEGGVQLYAVDFQINLVGDPFLGPLEMQGWPTAITSLRVETGTNEVVGGRLLAWSPDDVQRFPVGFGADGLLFTEDDPLEPLAAGWTVIDLNREPFARIRDAAVEVPIIEGDLELNDLSDRTYTEAFSALVDELRRRYPFTAYKGIDWDALHAEFGPMVQQAEEAGDAEAFNIAVMRFANVIGDGHVAVSPPDAFVAERFGGSLGIALGRTDDGAVVVRCVAPRGPAAKAGIAAGAEITSWGGEVPADALAAVPQLFSESTEAGLEEQRLLLLPRQPAGERVEVGFANPDGDSRQVPLRAARDQAGIGRPCGEDLVDPAEMPVTVDVLPSGIGYIKVNSFSEDLTLTLHAWEWALRRLRQLDTPALIIDIRDNGGGLSKLPIYMAGSFYDEPFTLAEQVFIDENGDQAMTAIDRVEPAPTRWRRPLAVLIGPDCVSACEIFAAALAHNPAHAIVGMGATAGVEGGVFPWLLPGDLAFQAPLIGFRDDAGAVFLEGTGVQPTVRVPRTAETLLLTPGTPDAVLSAAEQALLALDDAALPGADAPQAATPEPR